MNSNRPQPDYRYRSRSFESWFQTPLGRALLADQRACVDTHVETLTGARQLHIAISHRLPMATTTDFAQRIVTTPHWCPEVPHGVVVCDPDELPLPSDSIDLVIAHHSVDFSGYPHQVLREAARVLRGGGQMLVIGFNPVSTWGLRKLASRHRRGPWGGRFLLRSRMEDWLNLLDCGIDRNGSYFLRPPVQNARTLERLAFLDQLGGNSLLPLGAYYCILATKRIGAPIVRRPAWRQRKVIPLPATGKLGVSSSCHERS